MWKLFDIFAVVVGCAMRNLPPGALVTRQLRGALHHLAAFFAVC